MLLKLFYKIFCIIVSYLLSKTKIIFSCLRAVLAILPLPPFVKLYKKNNKCHLCLFKEEDENIQNMLMINVPLTLSSNAIYVVRVLKSANGNHLLTSFISDYRLCQFST